MGGMSKFRETDHPRSGDGTGRFAAREHGLPALTLNAGAPWGKADPAAILANVARCLGDEGGSEISRRLEQENPARVLAELDADNVHGRCRQDAGQDELYSPVWCPRCVRAQALEYQLRPTLDPEIRGTVPPGKPAFIITPATDGPPAGGRVRSTVLEADDAFNKAARQMLGAADDDEVTVIEAVEDLTPQWWTANFNTAITISAGEKSATFEDMGSLMRAVDSRAEDVTNTARRFSQDSGAEGPLMVGTAAVCLWAEDQERSEVIFGRIMLVHALGRGNVVGVLLRDGSQREIPVSEISAILETDDTRVLPEPGKGRGRGRK